MPSPPASPLDYERFPGAAGRALGKGYRRRDPESGVLHALVREHLATMLEEAAEADPRGYGLPRHVEGEFRQYLSCGILAHGFARVRCDQCRQEILVAFSCKGRGICPSCTSRRMAETAAWLRDRLFPEAPYRQWVLSFPKRVRYWLARDPRRVTAVLRLFVQAIAVRQRRVARRKGIPDGKVGAVSFVQRFGGLVNLNVHFHLVCPDGVFEETPHGLVFHPLDAPDHGELVSVCRKMARRVRRLLPDGAEEDSDALASVQALAVQTAMSPFLEEAPVEDDRSAFVEGFSVHAGVRIASWDRNGLERLCRYGARPAFSQERLSRTGSGMVSYLLKRPWPDGRTHLVLEPVAFLRRLAGIIPPPRAHLVRYSGIFAARSRLRSKLLALVPVPAPEWWRPVCPEPASPGSRYPRRLPWAELLRRVFAVDVLACPCGGRRRVLAFITDGEVVRKILRHLDLPATPVTAAPARAPPQESFPEWAEPPRQELEASPPAPEDDVDPIPPDDFDPVGSGEEG